MSVLIKGMKMPETCIECMNSGLRTAIRCKEWTKISAGLWKNHRAISCHLTEVTEPHGRLIDGDALQCKVDDIGLGYYEVLGVTEDTIDSAPTVIEAEGE